MQVDRVEVTPRRLRRPRVERGDGREAVLVGPGLEFAREALELAQARVVVVALERRVAKLPAEGQVELGKLVVDELVHERVGLGRDPDADTVLQRVERRRHQVGDRLADPGSRLDGSVRPRAEGLEYRTGHLELLGTGLVALVHASGDAVSRELAQNRFRFGARALDLIGVVQCLGLVGGHLAAAPLLQVEEAARGLSAGDSSEHRAYRPGRGRRELGQPVQQPGRQIGEAHQRDAPDRGERFDIRQCAVSRALGADSERLGEVRQPVRAEPGQGDPHHLQRVEPRAPKRMAPCNTLDERTVERCVVRHDVSAADELDEPEDGRLRAHLALEHLVGDPGELRDLGRDGNQRIDERREGPYDVRAAHDRGGDLDDAVAVRVVAGRLDVDHRDLVVETERRRASAFGKRPVGRFDGFVRTRDEECGEILESHAQRLARCDDPPNARRGALWAPRKDIASQTGGY